MCAPFIVCSLWQVRLMIYMYRHREHTINICIVMFIWYICVLPLLCALCGKAWWYICTDIGSTQSKYVSSFLYLMVYMCARCVCTYVSSGSLCLHIRIIRLPVSVHMYYQAPCVCTCVLSALCVAPVLYMCIISSFAKETYDDTYVCSLCLYICIVSSQCLLLCYTYVSLDINICIIIGLFCKRADDTYVQTQGA